jgi:membrane fusion protein, copper/silver efflux system
MRILFAFLLGAALSAIAFFTFTLPHGDMPQAEKKPLYWVAPMDPNYRRDAPGKSPMGMDLVPVYAEPNDASEVRIDPQTVQNLGISSSPAQLAKLQRELLASGTLQYREDGLEHVHSRVSGWVEKLQTRSQGVRVKQGDVLLYIYSLELINAQRDFLSTLNHADKTMRLSAHSRLTALGMDDIDINQLQHSQQVQEKVAIRARQAGIISVLNVREGMYVMPASEMMTIADDQQLWFIAEIYESQRSGLQTGATANIHINALHKTLQAKLDFIYPELDNSSRSLRLRFVVPNANTNLMPGMYASAQLLLENATAHVLIPRQSLIRDGKQDRIIRQLEDGRFAVVPVQVGQSDGQLIEILQGINAGDLIVSRGQFLLDSETNIDVALQKMHSTSSEPARVWAKGTFIGMQNGQAEIAHDAIPEWQWGSMQMLFTLDNSVNHSQLHANQPIEFCVDKHADGSYHISAIRPLHTNKTSTTPAAMGAQPDMSAHDMSQHDMSQQQGAH